MTEQEIISYLKQNKGKGIAFGFMPEEVQEWCKEHKDEDIFMCFSARNWERFMQIACFIDAIYCLIDDYEPKTKFEPHWEEFEIDEEGFFHIKRGSDFIYYHWFNWQKFLRDNFDKYSNFGGWLYSDDKSQVWSTNPCFGDNDGFYARAGTEAEIKPVMPTKVRFWRRKE